MTPMIRRTRGRGLIAAFAVLAATGACDVFDVTNPGPISEEALETEAAGRTVLVGLIADVEVAIDDASYYGGVASTDLSADATQGWVRNMGDGILTSEDASNVWDTAQRARWVAEEGVNRLQRTQSNPGQSPLVAAAHLWAGYANRILGDNVCVAVFDGGPSGPNAEYYTRAMDHFMTARTMAEDIGPSADSLRLAAMAGMAQSQLILGEYAAAAVLASQIPDDFLWVANRSDNTAREQNRIWEATFLSTQATVHGTLSDSLGPNGDPRTPWVDMNMTGSSGARPFYRQLKHDTRGSDIALAKGAEMRLIEAEAALRAGDVDEAVGFINDVRLSVPVMPVDTTTATEAWLALDRERHFVLWLEGRRLKDNQRLSESGLSPWSTAFMEGRDSCFPPSLTEINSNPNL
jgi:starch-binding outer membrane protein, SusD/RagB family